VLVEADLSQIEMRIAAELSGCRNLLDAFYKGEDVHWKTAIREIARGAGKAELVKDTALKAIKNGHPFQGTLTYSSAIDILLKIGHNKAIKINSDWKEVRKKAKAINFGFLFGMWYKKFKIYARDNYGIIVTEQEAKAAYNAYFELYPELKDWHTRQQNFARRNGYVMSLSGRKRRLPLAKSSNEKEYKPAMRQGINSPVQSFANELNLMAAIQLNKEFGPEVYRLVGTVHDSCLSWIRKNRVTKVVPRILEVMSHPELLDELNIRLRIPIEAEASIGPWGQGVSLEEWKSSRSAKVA
jgi:DNA polymerase I-like protein with 3'-5' exonuclease and polymerase domains